MNQEITFLTDGGDTVRSLAADMSPCAEHVLDWFHITMRLTVLGQYAKGLVHHDEHEAQDAERVLYRGLNCWIPAFIRLCESPVNSTSG